MTYQAIFTGWDDLTIEDLLVAYRKAKADSFFENTFPVAIKFAEYEQEGNDSNLLIVFYVQIMPDDLVMQLHRF